jgi:hypothetical protein
MTNFEDLALHEVLRSSLGSSARFGPYDRDNRTPMNFVLDEVERELGASFRVYWVDGGHPEVFCLTGFSPAPIIFSTRYLCLAAFARRLFAESLLENVLVDVTERMALKVIGEMALRHGDPDFAVIAFVKSVTDKGIWIEDGDDQLITLEHQPIHENYMAVWFYGLLHELGHLPSPTAEKLAAMDIFSNTTISSLVSEQIKKTLWALPDDLKQVAILRADPGSKDSIIRVDHLRSEGFADIFAARLLLSCTIEIMRKLNQKKFDVVRFLQEIVIFFNIIAFIDRCRRVATMGSLGEEKRQARFEAAVEDALVPVAISVRGLMVRQYLDYTLANYLNDKPTTQQFQEAEELNNTITGGFSETIKKVDSGFAKAMQFSLFPERRKNEWTILDDFRSELLKSETLSQPAVAEARRFCEKAESLGVGGKLINALKEIITDPHNPVKPNIIGDYLYFLPWVEGPDDFNCPFSLETKYGRVVFVFTEHELYDKFFELSAVDLKPGFTLKSAVLPVSRKERLGPELAAHMPAGPFQLIVEGTEEFANYMKELADGSIFEGAGN